MTDLVFVYGLFSTGEPDRIRYVGVSNNPERRLKDHLKDTSVHGSYKHSWIKQQISSGHEIFFRIIEQFNTREEAYAAEMWWIDHLRSTTVGLTNLSNGGEGYMVNPWDRPDVRAVMTAQRKSRRDNPQFMQSVSEHWQSYWASEENREAQSIRTSKHFEQNPEARVAASVKQTNHWNSLSEDEKSRRVLKMLLTKKFRLAEQNNWILSVLN